MILASVRSPMYCVPVTANSVTRVWKPGKHEEHKLHLSARSFFSPAIHGGAVREGFGLVGILLPLSSTLAQRYRLSCGSETGSSSAKGASPHAVLPYSNYARKPIQSSRPPRNGYGRTQSRFFAVGTPQAIQRTNGESSLVRSGGVEMKSDITLRLTRTQYRAYAEQVKQAGCCLSLSTFKAMGNAWGMYNPWAQSVVRDVSVEETKYDERAVIELATSIKTADLRNVQRPEIDWSALEDHEIYPFVVAHEIGHRVDNFSIWDMSRIEDEQVQNQCTSVLRSINEVLADRHAWAQVRPGEPVPLCEYGKSVAETVAASLELLNKYAPRVRRGSFHVCQAGQYQYVPQSMLMTNELTSFVGPAVSGELVGSIREKARTYRRDTRSRT